jgi:DUF1680 family protein
MSGRRTRPRGQFFGPLNPSSHNAYELRPLALSDVFLDEAGMLGAWQRLNVESTLPHCIVNLETSGALDNVRRLVGKSTAAYRGMVFQDSDVYKTVEAASWALGIDEIAGFRKFVDLTTTLLTEAQDADGYLNSWFQNVHPEQRWQDLRWGHEMYCAGHLIQAGVAAARAGGNIELLKVARRFADLLVRRFGSGGQEGICGHPGIETALIELYRLTRERAYLELSQRMIELRGHGLLGDDKFGSRYFQDHRPVREAVEATGHAVRQLYLAAGVTDLYLETGDRSLLGAMEALWLNAFEKKTYITGGQGSRHRDESFGDDYELPPDRAYAETCAAVASFMWNWRLLLATGDGRYADAMERLLYNVIAASVSIDGNHFFYSNPLQLRAGHDGSSEDSPSQRLSWYSCACCPPNLARLIASLQHYVATQNDSGIQLHLFTQGTVIARGSFGDVKLEVKANYPWDGRLRLIVLKGDGHWELSIRRPGWTDAAAVRLDGSTRAVEPDGKGYFRLSGPWRVGSSVELDFSMNTRLMRAHPHVDAVRGCGALMRGPVVYCVEEGDVAGQHSIEDLVIDQSRLPEPDPHHTSALAPVVLTGDVSVVPSSPGVPLYQSRVATPGPADIRARMVAIPYFRWANRGVRGMRVWLRSTEGAESSNPR